MGINVLTKNQKLKTNYRSLLGCLIACLLLAACDPQPTPPEKSLWGVINTAGSAPQTAAPALAVDDSSNWRMLAWTGVTEGEARLFARHATSNQVKILALKAYQPYDLALYPAGNGKFHLLWLDHTADSGWPALNTSLINAEAIAEVDKQTISSATTYHYAAAADSLGGLRVVWSSGLLSEPDLYTSLIDGKGRPGFPVKLTTNADYPSVLQAANGVQIYWLSGGQVMRGKLDNDALTGIEPITTSISLNPGDRLAAFTAAQDMTQGYVFWQIVRASGTPEAWFSTGDLTAGRWSPPALLTLPPSAPGNVDTGFNTGLVNIALPGLGSAPTPVQWASPLAGQYPSVPVIVYSDEGIGVVYLRWGSVAGYQLLYQPGPLNGAPVIVSDRNNDLYAAWSQPSDELSEMRLTATR